MSVLLFSPEALARDIAIVEAQVPADHTWALIGTTDELGVQAMILVERDFEHGTLKAAGVLRHTWAGDNLVGASLIFSGGARK